MNELSLYPLYGLYGITFICTCFLWTVRELIRLFWRFCSCWFFYSEINSSAVWIWMYALKYIYLVSVITKEKMHSMSKSYIIPPIGQLRFFDVMASYCKVSICVHWCPRLMSDSQCFFFTFCHFIPSSNHVPCALLNSTHFTMYFKLIIHFPPT